jgi:peptidoglycan/LPS O-acetylase OafA/YrhL
LCRLGITQVWAVLGLIAASGAVYASQATRHPIVLCLFFFYLGAFTCQVHAWLQEQVASRQTTLVALGVAACALVAWLTVAGFIRPMYCVAVLGPVALLALVRWVRPSTAKHTAALTQLGHMTYSSYLWHFPLQLAAALWFMHQPSALPAHSGWWLAGYLALTYAIALPSYHCIEAPVQRWLRRFTPAC